MKLGIFSIYLAMAASLYSAWIYLRLIYPELTVSGKKYSKDNLILAGRRSYFLMVTFVFIASLYLWFLIFSHQFQVDYVYRYSSQNLGLGYLFSAFWAGQEGSFLLWALLLAIMGLRLLKSAGPLENRAMFLLNMVQAGFLVLLIKASPFTLNLIGQIPPDGAGLNPLLQNPWMVIHPPILFLGYAAVTIPFVIAISALWQNEYTNWIKLSFPWTLFASLTLGVGIIVGGYWAYEVLGWGGYWGWDPVENSSLLAWLAVLSMFHAMLVTRKNGGLQKTNFILTVLSFGLVLYATFLTRSGVLSDFSVHSFQDLGINSYLISYIFLSLFLGLGLLYQRVADIPGETMKFDKITKENVLFFTVVCLMISAFFIWIGTSSPILTKLIGTASQVQTDFYNRVNLPIGIIMMFLLGIAPFSKWGGEHLKKIINHLPPSIFIGAVAGILGYWFGLHDVWIILLLGLTGFAITSNMIVLLNRVRRGWEYSASSVSHIGLCLLFIGIIVSGNFSQDRRIALTKNELANVFNYKMTYTGEYNRGNGKEGITIKVDKDGESFEARPRLYMNDYTQSQMREPYVERSWMSDLYISPLQYIENRQDVSNLLTLTKGEKKIFAGYEIQFADFDMTSHENKGAFKIGAQLKLQKDGESFALIPAVLMDGATRQAEPAAIPGGKAGAVVNLTGIDAGNKKVELTFTNLSDKNVSTETAQSQVVVEVSNKPFMNILWFGTFLLTLGTGIAMKRRVDGLKIINNKKEDGNG